LKIDSKQSEYHFYYYTNEGEFTINLKTFLTYGLIIASTLIICSVDYLLNNQRYMDLIISTAIFIMMLFAIRRLNHA